MEDPPAHPPHPPHPALLAGDEDRERSVELLTRAVVEGRLTLEEFSDRVGIAQAARTQDELVVLTRDIPAAAPAVVAPEHPQYRVLMSKLVRSGPLELVPRSAFRCLFGTIVLDLSQARLTGPDTLLEIYNLFGTVTIRVPEGVAVSVEGGGAFASQVVEPASAPPPPGAPRLRISMSGPGGTLYVRSHEPERNPLRRLLGRG